MYFLLPATLPTELYKLISNSFKTTPDCLICQPYVLIFKTWSLRLGSTINQQAKTSLTLEPNSFKLPFSSFKPSINKYILDEWQTSWNNSIENKLLEIKPTIGEYQSVVRNIRKEVVLAHDLSCQQSYRNPMS